ncbi:MAG TPA: hypothetical protein DIW36_05630 [Ruminococcaceae bacterium]|nr:hypothetical protein [Oscillospiraceae bacterium]
MRPLKEIFIEEYWDIAFRRYSNDDTVADADKKSYAFDELKATKRYWYADPFLFKKDDQTFLFVEMFDNVTEKGVIGCSKFIDGKFTQPTVVLEESFHLSYPYVFEENGIVYMMPETRDDGCIQLYRAEKFPTEWGKDRVIVKIEDAVDTVIDGDDIITSVITSPAEMKTQLEIYNIKTGEPSFKNPVKSADQISRGAGRIIDHNGMRLRPAQNCTNANYGSGLIFYEISKSENNYSEKKYSELFPSQIISDSGKIFGVHTYAKTENIEIVDVKKKRIKLKRIYWIIKKKI